MSATKFSRYAEVPADARFIPVRSIRGILERALVASLTDKTPEEQEDAGLEFGFYNDENSVTSLVLKWRDAGRLQVYRSTGGPIAQGPITDGVLRLDDLRALLAEEFDTGLVGQGAVEKRGASSVEPVPEQCAPSLESAVATDALSPAAIVRKSRRRANPLAAVLIEAKRTALDPTDWQSVWGALVKLAEPATRPAPLLGYVDGEGVQYRTDNPEQPVAYLTREAFRKRFGRHG